MTVIGSHRPVTEEILSHQITKQQITDIGNIIFSTRVQLDNDRLGLDSNIWFGADADRFHSKWESEVNAKLIAATNAVFRMETEEL